MPLWSLIPAAANLAVTAANKPKEERLQAKYRVFEEVYFPFTRATGR